MAEPVLNKEEQTAVLDARIRSNARWNKLIKTVIDGLDMDGKILNKLASQIMDNIVGSYSYNENLVKGARAVKLNVGYVRKVVRSAINDGVITVEDLDEGVQMISEGKQITDVVNLFVDRERNING